MTLDRAIELFFQSVAAKRSRTHPCLMEKMENLWVLRDGPGRKNPRKTEVVASRIPPEQLAQRVAKIGLGWHFLCHIHPAEAEFESIRSQYKSLGYRALATEWMFIHDLQNIPFFSSDPPVRIVATQDEADRIPQQAPHKRKLLKGSTQFAIWDDRRDYGWVTSYPVEDCSCVLDLYVHENLRRRGYGQALMSRLLEHDKEQNKAASILLASNAGSKLYPRLGYQQIAILQMFCPLRRD